MKDKKTDWTDEQLKIFYDKLRGVTEFRHGETEWVGFNCACSKCKVIIKESHPTKTLVNTEHFKQPCPVPDAWPDNDATLSEEIRVWMEKRDNTGVDDDPAYVDYWVELQSMFLEHHPVSDGGNFWEYLLFECTPTDKITAFTSLFTV